MEEQRNQERGELSGYRRIGRSGDTQRRTSQQAVDHDGVQNDVDQCAGDLRGCGVYGEPCGLKQLLQDAEEYDAHRADTADSQIFYRHSGYDGIGGLRRDVGAYAK